MPICGPFRSSSACIRCLFSEVRLVSRFRRDETLVTHSLGAHVSRIVTQNPGDGLLVGNENSPFILQTNTRLVVVCEKNSWSSDFCVHVG